MSDSPSPHILVVDDNEVNRLIIVRMLEKTGYRVASATNGVQAIAAITVSRFDLIFMDCQMPEMDGFVATVRIRKMMDEGSVPDVPIIAFTAHALGEERQKCLDAGMNDCLVKPARKDDMLRMLKKWLPEQAMSQTR